ncbi:MAG: hypothetical protein JSS46_11675 [Proteobacteria bacterium]|nr:hypothetical protein [Pseudomonadota bacterium]
MISIPASRLPARPGCTYTRLAALASTLAALAVLLAPAPARAETIGGNPGPAHNYVCPHADGKPALACYLDAVVHLYTMCRDVKAIENIEFGYEKSTEGTNGAKTEYCLDKQKENIRKPFFAALKQAKISRQAEAALKALQAAWLSALANLQWRQGESDAAYKSRVVQPYEEFGDRIAGIEASYTEVALHSPSPTHAARERRVIRHAAPHTPEPRAAAPKHEANAN